MPAPSIIPGLKYRDAFAAIDFLIAAFGFQKNAVYADDESVHHAQLTHDGGMVMLGSIRENDPFSGLGPMSIYVIVDDVKSHHDRAVAAGAEIVIAPLEDADRGWCYTATDLEGNLWSFGEYRPETD